jgi:hypothetical protein
VSIFGKLWDRITDASKAAVGKSGSAKPTGTGAAAAPSAAPVTSAGPVTHAAPVTSAAPTAGGTTSAGTGGTASAPVDVEAIMTDLETKSGHKSNWRYSIVDLMSLLGMDNSLADRKALAQELGYTGDMSDSASMNIWLHKQVMRRMAENGGKVPADLLD